MNWTAIETIGEILGAAGVIITLIYLAPHRLGCPRDWNPTPQERQELVDEAVGKLLADFPPGS